MSKYKIGDRVGVNNPDSEYDGRVGEVVGYFDKGTGEQLAMLNIDGWANWPFFDDTELELVEPVVEYEYAMQITFGETPRRIDFWTTKEIAENKLKYHGDGSKSHGDPVWGPWTAKVVKRRKAGPVEDA